MRVKAEIDAASPLVRTTGKVAVVVLGAMSLVFLVRLHFGPEVWRKDIGPDWLQESAIAHGLPAYLPLPELAARFAGGHEMNDYAHATPHTPFTALVLLPLGWLPYPVVAALWLGLGLAMLAGSMLALVAVGPAKPTAARVAGATLLALAFPPVLDDLKLGQLGMPLVVLLVGAFVALRERRDGLGGVALGLAVALKLTGWPLIGWLLLERRFRAVGVALFTAVAMNLVTVPLVGFPTLVSYYLKIGPETGALNRGSVYNFALLTLGHRLFEGTDFTVLTGFVAPPLVSAPGLAAPFGLLALAVVGVATTVVAMRKGGTEEDRFDVGFALFTCFAVIANPLAWYCGLAMLVLPLWVALRLLVRPADHPVVLGALAAPAILVPPGALGALMGLGAHEGQIPFAVALLAEVPLVGCLLLMAWLVQLRASAAISPGAP